MSEVPLYLERSGELFELLDILFDNTGPEFVPASFRWTDNLYQNRLDGLTELDLERSGELLELLDVYA